MLSVECSPLNRQRRHWLDQDELGQLRADGQARVADLTNEIRLARQQLDDLMFTQAEFAQPLLQLGLRAKFTDAHRDAGPRTG